MAKRDAHRQSQPGLKQRLLLEIRPQDRHAGRERVPQGHARTQPPSCPFGRAAANTRYSKNCTTAFASASSFAASAFLRSSASRPADATASPPSAPRPPPWRPAPPPPPGWHGSAPPSSPPCRPKARTARDSLPKLAPCAAARTSSPGTRYSAGGPAPPRRPGGDSRRRQTRWPSRNGGRDPSRAPSSRPSRVRCASGRSACSARCPGWPRATAGRRRCSASYSAASLTATLRLTGSDCWAGQTLPMPPSPMTSSSLYRTATTRPASADGSCAAVPSARSARSRVAAGSANVTLASGSKNPPMSGWAASSRSTPARNSGRPRHAPSR